MGSHLNVNISSLKRGRIKNNFRAPLNSNSWIITGHKQTEIIIP